MTQGRSYNEETFKVRANTKVNELNDRSDNAVERAREYLND